MRSLGGIDRYLDELGRALHARGSVRRRFLRECRDHLVDAAVERGEDQAIRSFGPAADVAAAFDAEVAARRGLRSTLASFLAVLATGASTLALIHASSPEATAPTGWAVAFFVAMQLAGLATGLALLQALAARRSVVAPADAALLARRNACALLAAGLTMFAAGAALPGDGSPIVLLSGPALLGVAMVAVVRARALARRLEGSDALAVRPPLEDLGRLLGVALPSIDVGRLLLGVTCVGAAAALVRDRAEHATLTQAVGVAGIEAAAIVGCFVLLGPRLGLWRRAGVSAE